MEKHTIEICKYIRIQLCNINYAVVILLLPAHNTECLLCVDVKNSLFCIYISIIL